MQINSTTFWHGEKFPQIYSSIRYTIFTNDGKSSSPIYLAVIDGNLLLKGSLSDERYCLMVFITLSFIVDVIHYQGKPFRKLWKKNCRCKSTVIFCSSYNDNCYDCAAISRYTIIFDSQNRTIQSCFVESVIFTNFRTISLRGIIRFLLKRNVYRLLKIFFSCKWYSVMISIVR